MRQVLRHLRNPAMQDRPHGGDLVSARCLSRRDNGQGAGSVSFRGTGKGISAEVLPRIFDPVFTAKAEGTGLGLSVSHGIVERHSGRIEVKSAIGVGSIFTITLPLKVAEEGT